jgi:hypothetical protein
MIQLPDSIQDFVKQVHEGKAGSPQLFTHVWREFIQAVWDLLLDKDLIIAYKHGIMIKCANSITCRVYLCLLTYSADYPEKYRFSCQYHCSYSMTLVSHRMLMLSLKDKGNCPCPCCLITKKDISQLGTLRDRKRRVENGRKDNDDSLKNIQTAWKHIYRKSGAQFTSNALERMLKPTSEVPTEVRYRAFMLLNIDSAE